MNSKTPPQNLPNDKASIQQPEEAPQSLPQYDDLKDDVPGVETPEEKLKRIMREGEINKVNPEVPNTVGPDTVGVGQPTAQPVNQGQSLPATALPVDKKFEGTTKQFYDPNAGEVATNKKNKAKRGGKKAEF